MNNTRFLAFFRCGGLSLGVLTLAWQLQAQISITTLGTALPEDFNTLANTGATGTTLPPGWAFAESGTGANTTYGVSDGSFNTGNTYSYGTGAETDRAFGGLRSGSLNPFIGASYTNNTGHAIGELTITYRGEQWRLGTTNRPDRMDFQYSLTASAVNSGMYINYDALDFNAPVTSGTVGALNGNNAPNFTVISNTITGLNIPNGATFWIRWLDFDATNADDGLSVDNFSLTACETEVTCPESFSICSNAGTIPLTGHSPNGGTYSGPGVTNNMFDPVAAGPGMHTITYTAGPGICYPNNCSFTITVISCGSFPSMEWVYLGEAGQVNGSCTSESDCENNTLCFGLLYIPSVTGTLTSYTTGFFMDCEAGDDPVLSHQSCVMNTGNDFLDNLCDFPGFENFFHNFSGSSPGTKDVTVGVPVVIHQACFVVPDAPGSITLEEDEVTDLTASLDLPGGGVHDDFPSYTAFNIDSVVICALLPVKFASFEVKRGGDFMSSIEWITTEEISNSHFEVQRSNDSGRTFETIGQVDAVIQPRTINYYSYLDSQARPGMNYYRLKQVDRDGHFAYSAIRHINFTTDAFAVKSFPNPVNDVLQVYINRAGFPGTLHLVDMAGRELITQPFDAGDSDHALHINGLLPGVYSLLVQSGQTIHIEKIVVMR